MKRSRLGLLLLVLLLAGSFWLSGLAGARCRSLYPLLEEASVQALQNQWAPAAADLESARREWDAHSSLRSCLFPHQALEEIDTEFAELSAYLEARENVAFAALCRRVSSQVRALEDACTLSWENLF